MTIKLLKKEEEIFNIFPLLVELQNQHLESLPGLFRDYVSPEYLMEALKNSDSDFLQNIETEKNMCFAFEENGHIIGCAVCKDQIIGDADFEFEYSHHLFILAFTLDPQYRGQGNGKKAFNLLEEWAKKHGYNKMVLSVDTNNHTAISFYKNKEFRSEMMYMSKVFEKQN